MIEISQCEHWTCELNGLNWWCCKNVKNKKYNIDWFNSYFVNFKCVQSDDTLFVGHIVIETVTRDIRMESYFKSNECVASYILGIQSSVEMMSEMCMTICKRFAFNFIC